MSMNRNHDSVERAPRFQLLRGNGEAERLDRFLAAADPLQIAPSGGKERAGRLGRRTWRLRAVLSLLGLVSALSLSHPVVPVETAAKTLSRQKQARLLVRRGVELLAEDRSSEAIDDLKLAVQLAPDDAAAWVALADIQLHVYQSTQAERGYQRALSLDPANPRALRGLGTLYMRQGKDRRAEQMWTRGGIDQQLARLYLLEGLYQQALLHLTRLPRSGAGDPLIPRMEQAARVRRLDPALRSNLEPEPAGLSAWAESGWRLYQQRQYERAAFSFGKALDAYPRDVNALSGMGSALLALGRPTEARAHFEQALSLDGDNLRSLNGRAACLRSEGKPLEAIAAWRQVTELYPGVNDAIRGLALTYFSLQSYRQAEVYLAPLARKYPHDIRLLGALGVTLRKLGTEGARSRPAP
jgi:Flp pilus assembly protein TadD